MLRHMKVFVKAYENVLFCLNIWIYIKSYICMYMLRHYGSVKMCKECICIFAYIYEFS